MFVGGEAAGFVAVVVCKAQAEEAQMLERLYQAD